MPVLIAASLLAADFAALGQDIAAAERGGAELLHVDVMDGHFVPNLSMGPPVVAAIRRVATVPLDVHLMLDNPDAYIRRVRRTPARRESPCTSRCCRTCTARCSSSRRSGRQGGRRDQSVDAGRRRSKRSPATSIRCW